MSCLFCQIVEGTIPCTRVWENEHVLAFHDIHPVAPVHVLVIPKKHIASLQAVQPEQLPLVSHVIEAVQIIATQLKIADRGYRLLTNCGVEGGQVVHHLHFHLLGGEPLGPIRSRTLPA